MSAAATTSRSSRTPRTPWSSHPQSRPSTTPMTTSNLSPASVGQNEGPVAYNPAQTPQRSNVDPRAASPSYFGLAIQDDNDNPNNSDAGGHAKKNWRSPQSSSRSKLSEALQYAPQETNPSLAAFRKQSETKVFQLDTGSSITSAASPRPSHLRHYSQSSNSSSNTSPKQTTSDELKESSDENEKKSGSSLRSPLKRGLSSMTIEESDFGLPRRESPANLPTLNSRHLPRQLSGVDDRHPRLSLPTHRVEQLSSANDANALARSNTLPTELTGGQPTLLSSQDFAQLLRQTDSEEILLLDLRVSPQYAQSRVRGALNLCIPTTLLKRPSFNVQKLLETFTTDAEKKKFSQWKEMHYIVMYDASSVQMKDASSAVNTIKKFTSEGWEGVAYIVRGGHAEISKKFPDLIQKTGTYDSDQQDQRHLELSSRTAGGTQVAGGLSMPTQQAPANPFFGNIRQNMDLIGGVGQLPIKQPDLLTVKGFKLLPTWLQKAADELDKGKTVSDDFLRIEKDEQERMRNALSTNVIYGTPGPVEKSGIQVAGIEKGTKNRYKDILPFDHARVKIQNPSTSCDYINASHIKSEWSNRHYIATQAPMPATFEDFWRVVWEQDVRVIVMLSAEVEGGQRKCHPYWIPDNYGPMKVKAISEKKIALGPSNLNLPTPASYKSPLLTPQPERSTPMRQRAVTQINPFGSQDTPKDVPDETPYVVRRTVALSHASHPFQSMREITQLHYSNWPDFGAPAHASDLLALVEQTNIAVKKYSGGAKSDSDAPAPPDERPIFVHCSAGCGRTGTFCTVDTVIDMLKQQREAQRQPKPIHEGDEMEIDEEPWLRSDENDLVVKTVDDFRLQRLSMVQTLRQYVLCYETILEWLIKEMPEKYRRETLRRSFGG